MDIQIKQHTSDNKVDSPSPRTQEEEAAALFRESTSFTIQGTYPVEDVWVDPRTPKFNQAKHDATCAKNRKKRKKRRRR